jgi:hypothetical protein
MNRGNVQTHIESMPIKAGRILTRGVTRAPSDDEVRATVLRVTHDLATEGRADRDSGAASDVLRPVGIVDVITNGASA